MQFLQNRIVRAYIVITVGAILYMLRRYALPTFFDTEGLPFDIAGPSALYACYSGFALNTCADGFIVGLTIIGVVVAVGWGSLGMAIFAVILAIPPTVLFFALSPIWAPLLSLLIIPLALEIGLRFLLPAPTPEA
ncbi:hypothetical protein K2Z83_03780 [Oscillochloris sp. ZM17-4]|uniref:hypothetical protein n=1 Tax=Oscillochloris sp. ZM17-4 TaxID=2866714 RepID=UPI001C73C73D|nr:hypothetical protein [Oscillochloris sp. ZM17-4]MBX0326801.1 hypothetical protein [Oscillochloris sp. ZM17-4]